MITNISAKLLAKIPLNPGGFSLKSPLSDAKMLNGQVISREMSLKESLRRNRNVSPWAVENILDLRQKAALIYLEHNKYQDVAFELSGAGRCLADYADYLYRDQSSEERSSPVWQQNLRVLYERAVEYHVNAIYYFRQGNGDRSKLALELSYFARLLKELGKRYGQNWSSAGQNRQIIAYHQEAALIFDSLGKYDDLCYEYFRIAEFMLKMAKADRRYYQEAEGYAQKALALVDQCRMPAKRRPDVIAILTEASEGMAKAI